MTFEGKYLIPLVAAFGLVFFTVPALAAEQDETATGHQPLQVTIRPNPRIRFDGHFGDRARVGLPRLRQTYHCPDWSLYTCDILTRLEQVNTDSFTVNLKATVAELAYETYKEDGAKPDLGLMMGRRYYGLPRYVILAQLGIDPGLPEEGALNDGIYGSLYYANPASIGDRIGRPIILTLGKSQIERLAGDDGILGF